MLLFFVALVPPPQTTQLGIHFTLGRAGCEADLEQTIALRGKQEVTGWSDKDGWTLLHVTCGNYRPSLASAMRLIKEGANPNRMDNEHRTPLHRCAIEGTSEHQAIARYLLNHGADRLMKTRHGYTALDHAKHHGHTTMARLLAEHGVAPAAAEGVEQVWACLLMFGHCLATYRAAPHMMCHH